MRTAILVHGGFHGGWCWRKVATRLRLAGWAVYTPTLTGVGDRSHLASPTIDLATHVEDVAGLIDVEEIGDLVLCGHSAGGVVVTAVADRLHDRIRHVVHLDTGVPTDGQSYFDVIGEETGMPKLLRDHAAAHGDGWLVRPAPFFSAESLGVTDPDDAAWVDRRLTSHPLAPLDDKVALVGNVDRVPKTYVRAERLPIPTLDQLASNLGHMADWTVERWDCGHDMMITEPDRVCELLDRVGS